MIWPLSFVHSPFDGFYLQGRTRLVNLTPEIVQQWSHVPNGRFKGAPGSLAGENAGPMHAEADDRDYLSDAELLQRHTNGDDEAISLLLSRHTEALYRFCLQRVRNPTDAEDLCQESLLRAVSRIDTLHSGAAFRTWLFRIAHNLSIDWGRRSGHIQTFPLPDEDLAMLASAEEGPLERVQADEERAIVASALADLKESYREALVLHQVEGQRVADVAERMNLTRSATEVLLFRARRRLREAYTRRAKEMSGLAVIAGMRQLAAHLAAPILGGVLAPAAGAAVLATVGGTVIALSHAGGAHHLAAARPMASLERVMNFKKRSGLLEQQDHEGDEVQADQGLGEPLVVLGQPPEARGPSERALHDPAARQQDEAPLGLRQLDDLQLDAMRAGVLRRVLARIALIHVGQLHVLAGHLLDRVRQLGHLRPLLLVGRGNNHGQEVAECVHRDVGLAALLALVPVIPGSGAALRCRLQGAGIEDDGGGLGIASRCDPEQLPQVMDDSFKRAGFEPARAVG